MKQTSAVYGHLSSNTHFLVLFQHCFHFVRLNSTCPDGLCEVLDANMNGGVEI